MMVEPCALWLGSYEVKLNGWERYVQSIAKVTSDGDT